MKFAMKRYLLFAFEQYYPEGGMNDFISEHDTKKEAVKLIISLNDEWSRERTRMQLFDQNERRTVYKAVSRGR